VKWQARGNQNQNPNQNIHKISAEKCSEGPRIVVVMREGDRTRVDMMNEGNQTKKWVRKSANPMPDFDPRKEKETYQRERKELLRRDWGGSMSFVPHVGEHVVPENPIGKVSTLIKFLRICVELMKYETMLSTLYDMIGHCTRGMETPIAQRVVNQVLCSKRTNREFRFSAQVREYYVDNVILELGFDVNILPKKTWDMMGKPKLVWYLGQLRLTN
jgi:hypothetical protein